MREFILVMLIIGAMACGKAATEGVNGLQGNDGLVGPTGASGTTPSCTVTQTSMGALISCPDGSNAVVLHGESGKDCSFKGRSKKHGG